MQIFTGFTGCGRWNDNFVDTVFMGGVWNSGVWFLIEWRRLVVYENLLKS
jgi:hypothetical protein